MTYPPTEDDSTTGAPVSGPWWEPANPPPVPQEAASSGTWPLPPGAPADPIPATATPPLGTAAPDTAQVAPPAPVVARVPARTWVLMALVAAVVGGGVGAAVAAGVSGDNGTPSTVTIREGSATPGPATLGNVSIPSLVQKVLPAVVSIDVNAPSEGLEDQGTGMIISPDGMIVTNNHVIELAAEAGGTITVTQSGTTKKVSATLVGTDPTHDVALLKASHLTGLPVITFGDSNDAKVGDAVVAIGNALGLAAGTPTVTQGIVSATGRTVQASDSGTSQAENLTDMIQTDAAINPGNSGGPLIDSAGQVIGMNTAVAGSTSDGSSAQNIGFAIPAATIESLIPTLEKGGVLATGGGYLGVDVTTLTPQLRQEYGFTPQTGAVVLDVASGSPADLAGLQEGDVIVRIDGTAITTAAQLQTTIRNDKAGQKVRVDYYVGGEQQSATITLGSAALAQQQQQGSNIIIP